MLFRSEFHLENALNIPVTELITRHRELDQGVHTVLVCSTGIRSSLGVSILKRNGFDRITNLAGGMSGYSGFGKAPDCSVCFVPHGPGRKPGS